MLRGVNGLQRGGVCLWSVRGVVKYIQTWLCLTFIDCVGLAWSKHQIFLCFKFLRNRHYLSLCTDCSSFFNINENGITLSRILSFLLHLFRLSLKLPLISRRPDRF